MPDAFFSPTRISNRWINNHGEHALHVMIVIVARRSQHVRRAQEPYEQYRVDGQPFIGGIQIENVHAICVQTT